MKYSQQIIVKRWLPILEEYEKCKAKVTPRSFKFVKNLLSPTANSRSAEKALLF